jgi:hypothetical protein
MIAFIIKALITLILCFMIGMIALAAMVGGVALLGWAFHMALAEVVSPPLAALFTGLAAFGVALLFALLALFVLRVGTRWSSVAPAPLGAAPDALAPGAGYDAVAYLGQVVGSQAAMMFRSRPLVPPLAALAVGLVIGLSPRLRRAAFRFRR